MLPWVGWLALAGRLESLSRIPEMPFQKAVHGVLGEIHKALGAQSQPDYENWWAEALLGSLITEIQISSFCRQKIFFGHIFWATPMFWGNIIGFHKISSENGPKVDEKSKFVFRWLKHLSTPLLTMWDLPVHSERRALCVSLPIRPSPKNDDFSLGFNDFGGFWRFYEHNLFWIHEKVSKLVF